MPVDLSAIPAASDVSVDPAFEERWAAWRARGHRHEVAARRKLRFVAIAVAIVVVLVGLGFRLLGGAL